MKKRGSRSQDRNRPTRAAFYRKAENYKSGMANFQARHRDYVWGVGGEPVGSRSRRSEQWPPRVRLLRGLHSLAEE